MHTYHGFPFHDFQSPVRRAAYIAIERRLAAITDVVLAIGSGVATEALRRGLARAEGLRIVAPAVQGEVVVRTPQNRIAARCALGIDGDRPVVGTVGRVDYQKAPEHFVEAVAALRSRDVLAVWIGSGPQLEEARRLAKKHGLGGRMVFTGERSDVARLLPAFDVFAMASRYEGLPCALVEAIRCGLPAVATAVNSVPDLIIPGESGLLVRPGRPRELASAIDTLLEDGALARRCGERGRQLAGAQFEAERLGAVLDEVYSQRLGLDAMAMVQ